MSLGPEGRGLGGPTSMLGPHIDGTKERVLAKMVDIQVFHFFLYCNKN